MAERYQVKDQQGLTKWLVYERKYNPDAFDETMNQYGAYQDVIRIEAAGYDKEKK